MSERLVLISNGTDDWLRQARKKIDEDATIGDEESAIKEWEAGTPAQVQLISHSVSEPEPDRNLLRFGTWTVRDTSFASAASLQNVIRSMPAKPQLLLAGCMTAEGDVARATLSALETTLGVAVFGSTRVMGLYDFDDKGCKIPVGDPLWERPSVNRYAARAPYAVNGASLAAAGARIRPFATAERIRIFDGLPSDAMVFVEDLLSALTPPLQYEYPGMLTVPTRSITFVVSPTERLLVDSLFSNRLVRILRVATTGARTEIIFPVSSQRRTKIAETFGRGGLR